MDEQVIVNPALSCGQCEFCRRGEESLCTSFGIMGLSRSGTFAEQVAVPAGNCYPRPPHLSDEEAGVLALDHVTAWRMLMTRAQLKPGETVLIHGIGGEGPRRSATGEIGRRGLRRRRQSSCPRRQPRASHIQLRENCPWISTDCGSRRMG
jgi:Zn-dependent alcohol dehydrogenase